MFVVDTNVLVYAADEDAPEFGRCRELLEEWRRQAGAWYTTWGILYEFVRVTTHPRVMQRPWTIRDAWSFVASLLASPGLGLLGETDRHPTVLGEAAVELPDLAGNLIHELHTAILMREHGIKVIYTRDTDFHRFPFVEPIDPLRPGAS